MFWSLDLDDFHGSECGKGKYPLFKAVYRALEGEVPTEKPIKTSSPGGMSTTTGNTKPSGSCHSVPPYESSVMDTWCEQNCAMGFCPKTHCVCG